LQLQTDAQAAPPPQSFTHWVSQPGFAPELDVLDDDEVV
jgi:hypothetical protein